MAVVPPQELSQENVAFVMVKAKRDVCIVKIGFRHSFHWNHVKLAEVKAKSLTNPAVFAVDQVKLERIRN